ncbi:MAG: hypothetical protein L6R35_006896 [Caloplaca aegaea]|nr:MAG: hypothetical protein L6R35_006896 [Caloplaca aegaea]
MKPTKPLPYHSRFADTESYIDSLLSFATSSEIFQRLCGGVHILEFLTQDPDLYNSLLPEDWRQFFRSHDVPNILDVLMRTDLAVFGPSKAHPNDRCDRAGWLGGAVPPSSLLEYIKVVREHSLDRNLTSPSIIPELVSEYSLSRQVTVGMKPKKVHEVARLAKYVNRLTTELSLNRSCQVGHFVDFGSGQNYLGRALASAPYNRKVLALESKPLNINGARNMDVSAKLAKKEVIMRNKKQFRRQNHRKHHVKDLIPTLDSDDDRLAAPISADKDPAHGCDNKLEPNENNIQYIETIIQDGDLSSVLSRLPQQSNPPQRELIIISLHSCGNLLHHGLRSLTLNPSVRAVALVGCCYNLLTERLAPSPSPQPNLRSRHPRLQQTSSACDPHGFPMSERFMKYPHAHGPGIRFNITARMMAVQAPQNWTEQECNGFFTRHFYRALFQRILVDKGAIDGRTTDTEDCSHSASEEKSPPIILGSLRKQCYTSFTTYVHAAIDKLNDDPIHARRISSRMSGLSDEDIAEYEKRFGHKKKELSIVWSLMAFSAGVVESAIVVDRWQWLREQEEVKDCWVESVFDYGISPRNLVVVGIKG